MRPVVHGPATTRRARTRVRSVVVCLGPAPTPAPVSRRRTTTRVSGSALDAQRAHARTQRSKVPLPHARVAIQSP